MNCGIARQNRFGFAKNSPKQQTNKINKSLIIDKKAIKKHSLHSILSLTPKNQISISLKKQNKQKSSKGSNSISTKYRLTHYSNQNYSKHKTLKGSSLSILKQFSGQNKMNLKLKINYSVLQRVHKTLMGYSNITGQFKSPLSTKFKFATHSDEQDDNQKQRVSLSKLVLWRESKVLKTIENIYEQLMKLQIGQNERMKDIKQGQKHKFRLILKYEIKKYLMNRFKTQKLCKQNFINLCYSLYHYIDKVTYEQTIKQDNHLRAKSRILIIFSKFLAKEYNQDDLIFYLYSKNIFDCIFEREGDKIKKYICFQQIQTFLSILSNGNNQIYRYYQSYLANILHKQSLLQMHEILYHLLQNFQEKKSRVPNSFYDSFNRLNRKQPIKQKQNNKQQANNDEFWNMNPPHQQKISEGLYQLLLNQIGVQTKKLISYFEDQPIKNEKIVQLVLIKVIRMLNAIYSMDKCRWFEEILLIKDKILLAHGPDFDQIEVLQLQLNSIQKDYKNQSLKKQKLICFSKKLLTVRAFIKRLEKLIDCFIN